MSKITQLYAIADGYDDFLVEAYDGDMTLIEGASMDATKLKFSKESKEVKALIKSGAKAAKAKDYDAAEKDYNQALSKLKELRKEAEKLDDDKTSIAMLEHFTKALIAPLAVIFVLPHIFGASIAVSVAQITVALVGLIFGNKKISNFNLAMTTGKYEHHKEGSTNTMAVSKVNALVHFDNLIAVCESALKGIKDAKKSNA